MIYQRPIRCLLLGCCICLLPFLAFGQADQGFLHPHTAASGGCRSMSTGLPALFGNPAGLSLSSKPAFLISRQSRFGIRELASAAAGMAFAVNQVQLGALYTRYGFGGFSEQVGGLSSALLLTSHLTGGIQIRYFSSRHREIYTASRKLGFALGLKYAFSESFHLGMLLENPLAGQETSQASLPRKAALGASLELAANGRIFLEAEQEAGERMRIKSGMEYRIIPGLRASVGMGSRPACWSFGTAYQYGKTSLHMSFVYHQILGWSPSIALHFTP